MNTTETEIKNPPASPPAAGPGAMSNAVPAKKGTPLFHRPGIVLLLVLIAIAGIVFAATVFVHVLTHETTDDAFIDGHVVSIAPKISGKVHAVHVTDNQEVRKGDVLFEIDPADYEAVVAQKKAALEVSIAKQKSADVAVDQAQTHLKTIAAGLESAQATADATKVSTDLTHSDLNRNQSLIKTGAISSQDFEHTKSAADSADANLQSKVKEVDAAKAYLDEARAQADSYVAQAGAAKADVNQARAMLAQAALQLDYARVTACEDGRVTSKAVEPGDYVQTGQALMALVPHEVWVTANFKETQITLMRPGGQPVEVGVDAYPDRKLRAHVDSIQAGSGARFSLLPPENATGNFVKVVQRVPVKIVFDEKMEVQQVLGPGMSAVPDVRIKNSGGTIFVVTIVAALAIFIVIVAALFWLKKARSE